MLLLRPSLPVPLYPLLLPLQQPVAATVCVRQLKAALALPRLLLLLPLCPLPPPPSLFLPLLSLNILLPLAPPPCPCSMCACNSALESHQKFHYMRFGGGALPGEVRKEEKRKRKRGIWKMGAGKERGNFRIRRSICKISNHKLPNQNLYSVMFSLCCAGS